MDYKAFLEMVEEELDFVSGFDLGQEDELLLGAAALLQLKSYIPYRMAMEQRVAEAEAMQECLDAAWASEDPDVKALQHQLFGDVKPSLDEFIRRLAELASDSSSAE